MFMIGDKDCTQDCFDGSLTGGRMLNRSESKIAPEVKEIAAQACKRSTAHYGDWPRYDEEWATPPEVGAPIVIK